FTAELPGQAGCYFVSAPQAAIGHLLYSHFRGINMLPSPGCILVEPDAVVALRAPGTFRPPHVGRRWQRVKIISAGDTLARRNRPAKFNRDILEPLGAFKPPVSKKLSVERRSQNWNPSRAVRAMMLQRFCCDVGEVSSVVAGPGQRDLRI